MQTLLDFYSKGEGNKHYEDNIIDLRINKVDKAITQTFVPFYVSIKKTKIDSKDTKFADMRKKMSTTVTY